MSNTKKLTKREKFEMLKGIDAVVSNPILAEFIDHELELLARKNASGGEKKMTAVQVANEGIKTEILECMGEHPNQLFTISEMLKSFPCCAELSNQRVSALVRQLVADGKVERVEEKRKAFFKLA
jgi:hypothetical protein